LSFLQKLFLQQCLLAAVDGAALAAHRDKLSAAIAVVTPAAAVSAQPLLLIETSCQVYGRSWRSFSFKQMWLLIETSYRYCYCSSGSSNDKLLAALATAAAAHRDKLSAVVRYCSYSSFQRQIVIHSRSSNQHPGQLNNDSSKLQRQQNQHQLITLAAATHRSCCESTATCCSTNHDSSDLELNLLL
jgi:hypothetical protein